MPWGLECSIWRAAACELLLSVNFRGNLSALLHFPAFLTGPAASSMCSIGLGGPSQCQLEWTEGLESVPFA